MAERIIRIWIPEVSMQEVASGFKKGDAISELIYYRDITLAVKIFQDKGLIGPGDEIDIKLLEDPQITSYTEDRNSKIIELTHDENGKVVDAEIEYFTFKPEVDRRN